MSAFELAVGQVWKYLAAKVQTETIVYLNDTSVVTDLDCKDAVDFYKKEYFLENFSLVKHQNGADICEEEWEYEWKDRVEVGDMYWAVGHWCKCSVMFNAGTPIITRTPKVTEAAKEPEAAWVDLPVETNKAGWMYVESTEEVVGLSGATHTPSGLVDHKDLIGFVYDFPFCGVEFVKLSMNPRRPIPNSGEPAYVPKAVRFKREVSK